MISTVCIPTILALLSSSLSVEVNVFVQPSTRVNRLLSAKLPFVTWIKIVNDNTNHTIALYEYGIGIVNDNYRGKINVDESGNLLLNKITRADGGTYICEVEITDDQPKIDFGIVNITVLYIDAPTIHVPTNVVDGNMLKIVCYSGPAKPNPKLIIYKDHQSIASRIDATLSYVANNTTHDDTGNYFCSASNEAGSKNSDTKRLNVQYIDQNVSFSSTVLQGMLSIKCQVNADPAPKYTLYKDNKAIKSEIGDVMEYNINNVKLKDAGNYYCMATNIVGIVKSEKLSFSVALLQQGDSLVRQITSGGVGFLIGCFILFSIFCIAKFSPAKLIVNTNRTCPHCQSNQVFYRTSIGDYGSEVNKEELRTQFTEEEDGYLKAISPDHGPPPNSLTGDRGLTSERLYEDIQ